MFEDGVFGVLRPVLDVHEVLAALGLTAPEDGADVVEDAWSDERADLPAEVSGPFARLQPPELEVLWARWGRLFEPGEGAQDRLGRVELLEAVGTQLAVWQARELAALAGLRRAEQVRVHGPQAAAVRLDPDGWVPSEVGFALGLSEGQVRRRLGMAQALGRYPVAAGLLAAGGVPVWTGMRLLELLDGVAGLVSAARLAEIETATVGWLSARPRTVSQLTVRMRRLQAAAQAAGDAGDAAARAAAAAAAAMRPAGPPARPPTAPTAPAALRVRAIRVRETRVIGCWWGGTGSGGWWCRGWGMAPRRCGRCCPRQTRWRWRRRWTRRCRGWPTCRPRPVRPAPGRSAARTGWWPR